MRSLPIALLAVAVLFTAANVATATPEEEIAQLKAQVAALKQQLLELKGQIAELRFEMETMKAAGGGHSTVPVAPPVVPPIEGPQVPPVVPPVAPPAIPVIPGADSPVGVYGVDANVLADAIYQMAMQQMGAQLQGLPADQRAQYEQMMKQQALSQAQAMKIDLELKADSTWQIGMSMMGQQQTYGGTWTQSGNRITFTQTTENGQPSTSPDTKTATYESGKITLDPDDEMPLKLVLIRK